jgi:K+-sensing histidine kinase KdpD
MSEGSEQGWAGTDGMLPSLAAAAHELKSPLVLSRQLGFMLQRDDLTSSERSVLANQLILTAERGLRLTSDLTKVARLEDALFDLEPINPTAMCEDIVRELTPLFIAHDRQLTLKTRKHPLLLVANRDLLRRVVINFSDNALYYSEAGSAVELQVSALQGGRIIRLGVRDYGPALSSDMWQTLQAKLGKVPQPVHARPQSSGLGLYIAGLFAQTMNGTIGAVRHRDGATFYVELDASRQLSFL